jgi:hypothetical protein
MKLLRTLALGKGATTRRQLLKALGASAAVTPFLPSLDSWAQVKDPKRLLLLFTSSGIVPEVWYPTGTETNWTFPAGGSMEPLNRHKADLIIPRNLKRYWGGGGGHEASTGGLWTGNSCKGSVAQAASVDQIIAKNIPKQTDFATFQFGVHVTYHAEGDITSKLTGNNPYIIHAGPGQKILAECNPVKAYDKLFAGLGQGGPADTMAMDKLRAERKSVLDILKEDVKDVSDKVAKEDRQKIESHNQALREIEQRLDSGGAKMVGAIPKPDGSIALDRNANYPALIGVMNKLAVAALAADRTRIASLQWSRGFSKITHSWVGAKEGHHYISHKTSEKVMLAKIQGWYNTRYAELLDEFKKVKEGAGTLLDNTLCVYSNELALGWTHGCDPAATWWATGAQGKFQGTVTPGRYIDFAGSGFDYNQMLQTMAQLMGATTVNKVGDYGKPGTIPVLMK